MKVIGSLLILIFLISCTSVEEPDPVTRVETRTVEVQRPAPRVPDVDQLRLRDVDWSVLTAENFEEQLENIDSRNAVFFAITSEGYENLSLNLSDLRALVEQQQSIIGIYEESYQ